MKMRTKRLITFLALSALILALGLYMMDASVIIYTFRITEGRTPNVFEPHLITGMNNWILAHSWEWIALLSFIPLALFLVLWKLYNWFQAMEKRLGIGEPEKGTH